VTFRVTRPFRRANWCHCSRCRKHAGAPAGVQGRVPRAGFELVSGTDLVEVYRPEGGGAVKAFCRVCGSSLFGGTWPDGPEVSIRLGALDDDPGIRPQYRSFWCDRVAWDPVPEDGLPRYTGRAPDP
jgi:hypothetical protein